MVVDVDVLVDVKVVFVVEAVNVVVVVVVTVEPPGQAAKVVDEQLPYTVLAAKHPVYGDCDATLGPA